jgi:integrase
MNFPPSRPRRTWEPKGVSWRYHFDQVIRENYEYKYLPGLAGLKRRTSYRTQEFFLETCFLLLNVLRFLLGFKIVKPKNLDARHARAIACWINSQIGELAPATLAGYATAWRALMRWSEKPWLVDVFDRELNPLATTRVLMAQRDKSWEPVRKCVEQIIERAWVLQDWVALCLVSQDAFGLRRRESVQVRPHLDFDFAARVLKVQVGAKNKRYREVPLDTDAQLEIARMLLAFVRQRAAKLGMSHDGCALAPPDLSLRQALDQYSNVVRDLGLTRKALGVTGHGARAGFACRKLQDLGVIAVVKGGDGRHPDGYQADLDAHLTVSEALGHSRKRVIGAYAGAASGRDRTQAAAMLRRHGLLMEGSDEATQQENTRRVNAYLLDPRGFLKQMKKPPDAGKEA